MKKNKIKELESKIAYLSNEIKKEQSNSIRENYKPKIKTNNENITWEQIESTSDINEQFYMALDSNINYLIRLISLINFLTMKKVNPKNLENSLNQLSDMSNNLNKQSLSVIIHFIKAVLLGIQLSINNRTSNNIRNFLLKLQNNIDDYSQYLSENDIIDIGFLLSHLE